MSKSFSDQWAEEDQRLAERYDKEIPALLEQYPELRLVGREIRSTDSDVSSPLLGSDGATHSDAGIDTLDITHKSLNGGV